MNVQFSTKKLQKEYEDGSKAAKAYGQQVGRKFIERVNIIKSTQNIDTLKQLPGLNCHPLKGNLKGLWAITLTGFYRLLFKVEDGPPVIVRIEKVSKHYDD